MSMENSAMISDESGCFDDKDSTKPGMGKREDDTMFTSQKVVDGALAGKHVPGNVCRLARGSYVENENPVDIDNLLKVLAEVPGSDCVIVVPQVTTIRGTLKNRWYGYSEKKNKTTSIDWAIYLLQLTKPERRL